MDLNSIINNFKSFAGGIGQSVENIISPPAPPPAPPPVQSPIPQGAAIPQGSPLPQPNIVQNILSNIGNSPLNPMNEIQGTARFFGSYLPQQQTPETPETPVQLPSQRQATPGYNPQQDISQAKPALPGVESYAQNQILNPIGQGINQMVNNPNLLNKGLGALQTLGGAFSLTPGGVGFNTSRGVIAGGLNAVRTGQPLGQAIGQGITQNSSIAQTGFGIKNPLLSIAVDLALNSPEAIVNGIKGISGLSQAFSDVSPNAYNIHPQDQLELNDIIGRYQAKTKLTPEDNNTLQVLADHYLGKNYSNAPTSKIASTFNDILAKQNGGIPGAAPMMGFTQTKPMLNDLQNALQAAQNPQDEATIVKQFTDNAIKDGTNLPAARAAINQEITSIAGVTGNFKLNEKVARTLQDDPDIGPRLTELYNSRDRISDALSTPNVPAGEKGLSQQDVKQNGQDLATPQGQQQIVDQYQQAVQNKPILDNVVNQTAQETGARPITALKNPDSAVEKVVEKRTDGRDYNVDDLNDVNRARLVYQDKGTLYKAIDTFKQNATAQGITIDKEQDFFKHPEDGYQGYHVDVKMPNGQTNEVQFHTEKSLAASEATHDFHAQYGDDLPSQAEKVKSQVNHEIMGGTNEQAQAVSQQIEARNAPLQAEAQQKALETASGNPEPLPWENGEQTQYERAGTVPTQAAIEAKTRGLIPVGKETVTGEQGEQLGTVNPKNRPLKPTQNRVDLPITGDTEKEHIQSAINNSERVKNEINVKGKDAYIFGKKLSPQDLKLAEGYEHGISIDDLAKKAQNPTAFKTFMGKMTDYYDFRLAADRAVGGSTPLRENYIPHRWDLSKPEDLARFNEIAAQKGIQPWNGLHAQPRVFDTYAQGEALGFKRQNPNILEDLKQDYNGASTILSQQALKQGLQQAAPGRVSATGTGITPEGKPFINSNIKGLEGMSFHPDVNKELQGFQQNTDKDLFTQIKDKGFAQGIKDTGVWNTFTSLYDHSTKGMKQFLLNFSGFHSINVSSNYAGVEILNPGKSVSGIAQSVHSFFSEEATQKVIDGFKSKMVKGSNYSVFDAGLRSGVNMDRSLPLEGLQKLNPFHAMSSAIFDRELYTLKLNLVDQVFGDGKIDPQSPQGIAAGKEINNIMGEMNYRTQNINPNTMKWLSRVFLAPQFTTSKYKVLLDSATNLKDLDNLNSAGNLARKAVIGKSIVLGTVSTLGTLLATGKFPNLQQILTNYTSSPTIQTNLKNPKGHLQDIATPESFLSEPLRPISGLLGGSTTALTHYANARLNPALSNIIKAYTNQDYYGNPIVNTNSKTPIPMQLAQNLGVGNLPIGAQNVVKMLQGKETGPQAAINIAGLRTLTSPNDPTAIYFNKLDAAKASLTNPNDVAAWNQLHPQTKDSDGNPLIDKTPLTKPAQFQTLLTAQANNKSNLYQTELNFEKSQPNHDPLWDWPEAQRTAYMQAQVISKDSPNGTNPMANALYLEIPQQAFDQRTAYFNGLVKQGVIPPSSSPPVAPKNVYSSPDVYETILAHPGMIQQIQSVQQGATVHDPIWNWTPQQIQSYMQAQVIAKNDPGGDKTTTNALYATIPQQLYDQRTAYFNNLVQSGQMKSLPPNQYKINTPPEVTSFWNQYFQQPQGSATRKSMLQTPVGQEALAVSQQQTVATNQLRTSMGLPPIMPSSGSSANFKLMSFHRAIGRELRYSAKKSSQKAFSLLSGGSSRSRVSVGKIARSSLAKVPQQHYQTMTIGRPSLARKVNLIPANTKVSYGRKHKFNLA